MNERRVVLWPVFCVVVLAACVAVHVFSSDRVVVADETPPGVPFAHLQRQIEELQEEVNALGSLLCNAFEEVEVGDTIVIRAKRPLEAPLGMRVSPRLEVQGDSKMIGDSGMPLPALEVQGDTKMIGDSGIPALLEVHGMTKMIGDSGIPALLEVHGATKMIGDSGMALPALEVQGDTKMIGDSGMPALLEVHGATKMIGDSGMPALLVLGGEVTLPGQDVAEFKGVVVAEDVRLTQQPPSDDIPY